jgi:hypothetical protein
MMVRRRTKIIIFFAGLFILMSGFGSSYYWITHVYLPDIINADENARLYQEWFAGDTFRADPGKLISRVELERFIKVNESLVFLVQRLRRKFEQNSLTSALDMIRMRPEWLATKYLALKRNGLSPREYDWIADCVVEFWIYRWKKESAEQLEAYGWNLKPSVNTDRLCQANHKLFLAYEDELDTILNTLWPQKEALSDSS